MPKTNFLGELGRRLRSARAKTGLGVRAYCRKIDVHPSVWSALENGNKTLYLESLRDLCDKADLSPSWLLLGLGPERKSALPELTDGAPRLSPEALDSMEYILQLETGLDEDARGRFHREVAKVLEKYAERSENEAVRKPLRANSLGLKQDKAGVVPEFKKRYRGRR